MVKAVGREAVENLIMSFMLMRKADYSVARRIICVSEHLVAPVNR